ARRTRSPGGQADHPERDARIAGPDALRRHHHVRRTHGAEGPQHRRSDRAPAATDRTGAGMTLAIAVDLLLAALLVATLAYGAMLHRRLGRLRQDRDRLAEVVGQFNEATARAVAGMEGIKATADASGTSLQSVIDRAGATIEDLRFLVERGERAAARLEA